MHPWGYAEKGAILKSGSMHVPAIGRQEIRPAGSGTRLKKTCSFLFF
jgi:hypothetical protein